LRVAAVWAKLPELKKEIDLLLKRVEALEKRTEAK
jgi:hypothetical protein